MDSKHSLTDSLHKISNLQNYNSWIYENIKKGISGRVLEIGCGIGNITDFILKDSRQVCAADIDGNYLKYACKKYKGNKKVKVKKLDIIKPGNKIKKGGYDTAVMLNVLEHIKDEKKAVVNVKNALVKNGKFVILVPAMQSIYGEMDKALGHHKRYNKAELKKLLEDNGFKIIDIFYLNFAGIIGWYFSGRILKKSHIPDNQAKIFDRYILPVTKPCERLIKPPAGQSIVAIAQKI
ncbi:MAG: class I SAM-dependent methyltransferase [Candidatus Goldbacteria bacterium]|nr:class I SAM-dependent methyltransferase [Candidatus Goldiibacteriota bacterium]